MTFSQNTNSDIGIFYENIVKSMLRKVSHKRMAKTTGSCVVLNLLKKDLILVLSCSRMGLKIFGLKRKSTSSIDANRKITARNLFLEVCTIESSSRRKTLRASIFRMNATRITLIFASVPLGTFSRGQPCTAKIPTYMQ